MENKRVCLIIHGKVHGVFFRASTKETANQLGLKGFVRNRLDGAVEIIAEGYENDLIKLINWCQTGPDMAKVDSVEQYWQPYVSEFKDFTIN